MHSDAQPFPERQTPNNLKGGRPKYILDLEAACSLHELGISWRDVAKTLGVARQTIYNHLHEAGLQPHGHNTQTSPMSPLMRP